MNDSDTGIDELLTAWEAAVADGDLDALADLVTEDAAFWSNGQAPVTGRAALKAAFEPIVALYTMHQEFQCEELLIAGDWAFMRGLEVNRLLSRETAEETTLRQRAFSVMHREAEGKWRFSRGMTNQPPEDD